jgi:hypothetical protein
MPRPVEDKTLAEGTVDGPDAVGAGYKRVKEYISRHIRANEWREAIRHPPSSP